MSEPTPPDVPLIAEYVALPGPVVWYGGKGQMTAKILPHLPDARVYVEPYGGAASLLFAKPPSPIEVYNDLHGDLVALFRVLQNPESFLRLKHRLTLTMKARSEYELAVDLLRDPATSEEERAWAFFVAMNQGFGGTYPTPGRWARDKSLVRSGMGKTVCLWWRRISWLDSWHERLAHVQIERRDAIQLIKEFDSPETVFYLDPPYVPDTRVSLSAYRHEQPPEHHEHLVETLLRVQGQVVLSGYAHSIYDPLVAAGWGTVSFSAAVGGAPGAASKSRTEQLWIRRAA